MIRFFRALSFAIISLIMAIVLGSVLLVPYIMLLDGERFDVRVIPFGIYISAWLSWLLIVPGFFLFYALPAFRLKIIPLLLVLAAYTVFAMLLELKFILPFFYGSRHSDTGTIEMLSFPYALVYFGSLLFCATRNRVPGPAGNKN